VGRSRGSARRAKIPDVGDDFKQLRRTFDAAADKYHDARPEYPERLFTTLMQVAELRPGDRLSRSAARLWQGHSPACAPGVSHHLPGDLFGVGCRRTDLSCRLP
jgi:hypothetical protein